MATLQGNVRVPIFSAAKIRREYTWLRAGGGTWTASEGTTARAQAEIWPEAGAGARAGAWPEAGTGARARAGAGTKAAMANPREESAIYVGVWVAWALWAPLHSVQRTVGWGAVVEVARGGDGATSEVAVPVAWVAWVAWVG